MSGLASRYGKRSGPERKTAPAIHGKGYWESGAEIWLVEARCFAEQKIPVSKEVQR